MFVVGRPPSVAPRHLPPWGGENLRCARLGVRCCWLPLFSPPKGGRCRRQRGGSARGGRMRPCAPAPPLCRSATSPPLGGEKLRCARLGVRCCWLSTFLPPLWGGEAEGRGGAPPAADGCGLVRPRPPSVAPRHLPPLGGENFLAARQISRWGEKILLCDGGALAGRGGWAWLGLFGFVRVLFRFSRL